MLRLLVVIKIIFVISCCRWEFTVDGEKTGLDAYHTTPDMAYESYVEVPCLVLKYFADVYLNAYLHKISFKISPNNLMNEK